MLQGNLSFDECITKRYSSIHEESHEKIINSIKDKGELRKGFRNFVDFINNNNDQFIIAGGGLDFIVDYCLTRNKIFNIPYVVPQIKLDSRGATLLPPNKIVVNFGHSNFKMDLIDGITCRSFNDFEEVKNFLICN